MKPGYVISQIQACPLDKVLNDKSFLYLKKDEVFSCTDTSNFNSISKIGKIILVIALLLTALFLASF